MSKCPRPKSRIKRVTPVFHLQTRQSDCKELTAHLIKSARKSGQLSLSGKGLASVPDKVWTLDSLDEAEIRLLEVNLDSDGDGDNWWQNVPLTVLDLSANTLLSLPPDIKNLYALTTLNLQDNGLTELPNEIGSLSNLTHLNISHNKLVSLPDSLWNLAELRYFLANHNEISVLSDNVADLVMLQEIDICHNKLKTLHPGLGFLIRLIKVNLSHNELLEMPPDLVNLRVLLELNLSYNQLTALPPMGELRRMELLYIDHNLITSFPDFTGCVALKELHLSGNSVKEIPSDHIDGLSQLRILKLKDNKLCELPNEIANLQHLVHLDLTNNCLTNVPSALAMLPHLQTLHLQGNPLQTIRQDLVKCGTVRLLKHLRQCLDSELELSAPSADCYGSTNFPDRYTMKNGRVLNLASRKLTSMPGEVFAEALEAEVCIVDISKNLLNEIPKGLVKLNTMVTDLNVSCNLLTKVPEFLGSFLNLQYLDLERNKLSDLPKDLEGVTKLKELVLSHNRFIHIPCCVFKLLGLEILKVSDNQLMEIPVEGLFNLKFLAVLNLNNNNISQVPPLLGKMTQLRSLEISGNPFRQPRYSILEKGTVEVLSYLRDRIP